VAYSILDLCGINPLSRVPLSDEGSLIRIKDRLTRRLSYSGNNSKNTGRFGTRNKRK
jgi:hypothetical protein